MRLTLSQIKNGHFTRNIRWGHCSPKCLVTLFPFIQFFNYILISEALFKIESKSF